MLETEARRAPVVTLLRLERSRTGDTKVGHYGGSHRQRDWKRKREHFLHQKNKSTDMN